MILTVEQLITALPACPADHITVHWPQVCAALEEFGIDTPMVELGVSATMVVETAKAFWPRSEQWAKGETPEQYFARYAPPNHVATVLGNRTIAEAVLYRGRGDVQITGRNNYLLCGEAIGLDLLASPEQLLDPTKSARSLAWFFAKHGHHDAQHRWGTLPQLCEDGDLVAIREAVNGGTNGLDEFTAVYHAIQAAA